MASETLQDSAIEPLTFSVWRALATSLGLPFRNPRIACLCILPPLLIMTAVAHLGMIGVVDAIDRSTIVLMLVGPVLIALELAAIAFTIYVWSWSVRGIAGIPRKEKRSIRVHAKRFGVFAIHLIPTMLLIIATSWLAPFFGTTVAALVPPFLISLILTLSCCPLLAATFDDRSLRSIFNSPPTRAIFWRSFALFLMLSMLTAVGIFMHRGFSAYIVQNYFAIAELDEVGSSNEMQIVSTLLVTSRILGALICAVWFTTAALLTYRHIKLIQTRNAIAAFD